MKQLTLSPELFNTSSDRKQVAVDTKWLHELIVKSHHQPPEHMMLNPAM